MTPYVLLAEQELLTHSHHRNSLPVGIHVALF